MEDVFVVFQWEMLFVVVGGDLFCFVGNELFKGNRDFEVWVIFVGCFSFDCFFPFLGVDDCFCGPITPFIWIATPVKPIYIRPFIQGFNSIYNDRRGQVYEVVNWF